MRLAFPCRAACKLMPKRRWRSPGWKSSMKTSAFVISLCNKACAPFLEKSISKDRLLRFTHMCMADMPSAGAGPPSRTVHDSPANSTFVTSAPMSDKMAPANAAEMPPRENSSTWIPTSGPPVFNASAPASPDPSWLRSCGLSVPQRSGAPAACSLSKMLNTLAFFDLEPSFLIKSELVEVATPSSTILNASSVLYPASANIFIVCSPTKGAVATGASGVLENAPGNLGTR
mmetsp:Transcript_44268/g.111252  ORF Transcript_44268/g.111252 Transcript_44268/m.111252 type:complete len:231 (-) Transcript_44268:132-824(-)